MHKWNFEIIFFEYHFTNERKTWMLEVEGQSTGREISSSLLTQVYITVRRVYYLT